MKVGFTGTRKDMSARQIVQLRFVLDRLIPTSIGIAAQTEFHHGGARGADQTARFMANARGFVIHCHPATGTPRDRLNNEIWHLPLPPLTRNRVIVKKIDLLIAAPESDREEQRSGTWATIRYARAAGVPVVMLWR